MRVAPSRPLPIRYLFLCIFHVLSFCLYLFIISTTPLALQLHQERIHMVRGNKEAQKRPTKSNGTLAMNLGLVTDHFLFILFLV